MNSHIHVPRDITVLGDLKLEKCPPQRGPMHSKARFVCMVAGTRGGKSRTAAKKFVFRILRDLNWAKSGTGPEWFKPNEAFGRGKDRRPRLHYWVVSPTVALLKEPKRYLFETIPPELFQDPNRPINSEGQMWLRDDVLIEFKSADNPLALVSVGLHGLWIDEAARVKSEAWAGNLRGRLSDKNGWCLLSSTPLGQNWLYEEIFRLGVKDDPKYDNEYASFQWHTADNLTVDRKEIEKVRKTMPARYFKREYEADFSAFLGNIYDEFSDKVHVVTEAQLRHDYGWGMRPLRELFRGNIEAGVDWGWTSPGAIVVVGDTGRELVVLEESYGSHVLIHDPREKDTWVGRAKALQAKWGIKRFHCDPSEPGNIVQFVRCGLPAIGGYNDIGHGIRRVAEQMHPVAEPGLTIGRPRLRILNTCINYIRETRAYVWDQLKGTDKMKEVPAPNQEDHALDAGRYVVVGMVPYEEPSQTEMSTAGGFKSVF